MTIETSTMVIPASGRLELPPNNYFLLFTATAAVDVRFQTRGSQEGFVGVTSNCLLKRVNPWSFAFITGPAGTSIQLAQGTENVIEDETDIRGTATSIAGVVQVNDVVRSLAASPAVVTRATAGADTIAANASRRAIWINNISGIAGSGGTAGAVLFLQSVAAGARRGIPIQDGQSLRIGISTAFDLRNDSGVTAAYNVQEET